MPSTARGLWYPDSTDHVRLWEHIQQAQESVQSAFDDAVTDTGWVSATTGWTIAAGWTIVNVSYRKFGPAVCGIHWSVNRTGATLTGSATGNITDTAVFTAIPTILRPTGLGFRTSYGVNQASAGNFLVDSTGQIELETLHATATIASGDNVIGDATYFVA